MSTTTYTFEDTYEWKDHNNVYKSSTTAPRHRKNSASSDNGSLTYSVATSTSATSVHSGTSSAHSESSSFENIKRALVDHEDDIASYFQREMELRQHRDPSSSKSIPHVKTGSSNGSSSRGGGNSSVEGAAATSNYHYTSNQNHSSYNTTSGGRSVAGESLAYSTDAESRTIRSLTTNDNDELTALHGTDYASVFTGQQSEADSRYRQPQQNTTNTTSIKSGSSTNGYNDLTYSSPDNNYNDGDINIFDDVLFSPAEYADGLKRRKEKKRRERREERSKKRSSSSQPEQQPQYQNGNYSTTQNNGNSNNNNNNNNPDPLKGNNNNAELFDEMDHSNTNSNLSLLSSSNHGNVMPTIPSGSSSTHTEEQNRNQQQQQQQHHQQTTKNLDRNDRLHVISDKQRTTDNTTGSKSRGMPIETSKTNGTTTKTITAVEGNENDNDKTLDDNGIPWWMFCLPDMIKWITPTTVVRR